MPEWSQKDRLRHEKEVLGFYVSGHPLEEHAELLRGLGTTPLGELSEHAEKEVRVAGIVTTLRKMRTKKGDWMAFLGIEDLTGNAEVIVFPKSWAAAEAFVAEDVALHVKGTVEVDGEKGKILADELSPLGRAAEGIAAGLLIRLPKAAAPSRIEAILAAAEEILTAAPGSCPVRFEMDEPELGRVILQAGARFNVAPEQELVTRLEAITGPETVTLVYC